MADCNHDCSNCSANCSSREGGIAKEAPHELSKIKKVIGVVSGKGGVGKSLVTSMMAVASRRLGYETAVLDADITGPSIGQTFGVHGRAQGNGMGILRAGIQDCLRRHPCVSSFRLGRYGEGETGVTIVSLR